MKMGYHLVHRPGGVANHYPDRRPPGNLGQIIRHQHAARAGAAECVEILARSEEREIGGTGPVERSEAGETNRAVADQAAAGQLGDGAGGQSTGLHAVISWTAATAARPEG